MIRASAVDRVESARVPLIAALICDVVAQGLVRPGLDSRVADVAAASVVEELCLVLGHGTGCWLSTEETGHLTIHELAGMVADIEPGGPSTITLLDKESAPPWLAVVPGIDGQTHWFLQHLEADPIGAHIMGVNYPDWYGEVVRERADWPTLDEIVTSFVGRVLAVPGSEQLVLAGYSSGVQLAVEVGRRLRDEGRLVGRLHLIDPLKSRTGKRTLTVGEMVLFRLSQLRRQQAPAMRIWGAVAQEASARDLTALISARELPGEPRLAALTASAANHWILRRALGSSSIDVSGFDVVLYTTPDSERADRHAADIRATSDAHVEYRYQTGHRDLFSDPRFRHDFGVEASRDLVNTSS